MVPDLWGAVSTAMPDNVCDISNGFLRFLEIKLQHPVYCASMRTCATNKKSYFSHVDKLKNNTILIIIIISAYRPCDPLRWWSPKIEIVINRTVIIHYNY